jgi:hypothetical protein
VKPGWFAFLLNIDRRIVFAVTFVAVLVPLIVPFQLAVNPTPHVVSVFERIEQLSKSGGTVLISFDYDPPSIPELQPMALAILKHCFSKGGKVVGMTHWPNGVGLAEQVMREAAEATGARYGEDYVFLGYKAGGGSLIINMGQDFYSAFPKDAQNDDIRTLGVTRSIQSLKDFDYVIDLAAGMTIEMWIVYGQEKYGFTLGAGCTAVIAPDMFPFLQSEQLDGLIGGLVGAAEYEVLIRQAGTATASMDAQSVTHIVLVLLIIFGNVMYLVERFRRGRQA